MNATAGGGRRSLWLLLGCQALMMAGLSLSMPFLAIYLHGGRGLPMGLVGLFASVTLLLTAVGQAMAGGASDRLGRKPVMVFSLAGRAVVTAVLAAAVWLELPVAAVLASHMLGAFIGGFYNPAAQGWVADRFPAGRRYEAYSLLRVAFNLGWAVGPALGGAVAGRSYAGAFLASAAVCGACAGLMARFVPESRAGGGPERAAAAAPRPLDPRFISFAVFAASIAVVMAHLVVPLSVHATEHIGVEPGDVGLLFSLNGLLVVTLQTGVARAMRGRRTTSALAAGSLLYAAGYAMVARAGSLGGLAAAVAVVTLGEMAVSPGLLTLAANLAPRDEVGRYAGLNGFVHQLGMAAGPLAGGLGLQFLSPRHPAAPWLLAAGLATFAAAGFLSLRPGLGPREEGLQGPDEERLAQAKASCPPAAEPGDGL